MKFLGMFFDDQDSFFKYICFVWLYTHFLAIKSEHDGITIEKIVDENPDLDSDYLSIHSNLCVFIKTVLIPSSIYKTLDPEVAKTLLLIDNNNLPEPCSKEELLQILPFLRSLITQIRNHFTESTYYTKPIHNIFSSICHECFGFIDIIEYTCLENTDRKNQYLHSMASARRNIKNGISNIENALNDIMLDNLANNIFNNTLNAGDSDNQILMEIIKIRNLKLVYAVNDDDDPDPNTPRGSLQLYLKYMKMVCALVETKFHEGYDRPQDFSFTRKFSTFKPATQEQCIFVFSFREEMEILERLECIQLFARYQFQQDEVLSRIIISTRVLHNIKTLADFSENHWEQEIKPRYWLLLGITNSLECLRQTNNYIVMVMPVDDYMEMQRESENKYIFFIRLNAIRNLIKKICNDALLTVSIYRSISNVADYIRHNKSTRYFEYDCLDRCIIIADTFEYDSIGRHIKMNDSFAHDSKGNSTASLLIALHMYPSDGNRVDSYENDNLGYRVEITENFEYDTMGKLALMKRQDHLSLKITHADHIEIRNTADWERYLIDNILRIGKNEYILSNTKLSNLIRTNRWCQNIIRDIPINDNQKKQPCKSGAMYSMAQLDVDSPNNLMQYCTVLKKSPTVVNKKTNIFNLIRQENINKYCVSYNANKPVSMN